MKPQHYKDIVIIFLLLSLGCLMVVLLTTDSKMRIGFSYYLLANSFLCHLAYRKYHEYCQCDTQHQRSWTKRIK